LARYIRLPRRVLLYADALGLALFAVVGTTKALDFGVSAPIAVLMGVITGVGGGIIRDLLCDDIPLILRGEIYGTAALAGATAYVLMLPYFPYWISALIAVLTVFIIRCVAIIWRIKAPYYRHGGG